MDNTMGTENENVSLGRRLREITERARANEEIQKFVALLTQEAELGRDKAHFDDLRELLPTMIGNGTIATWMAANELVMSNIVDQNTGKWNCTVSW